MANKKDFISWYGPEGNTVPFCEMDVRVGGAWRACIKSPQGEEYWMQGKYLEITSPSRLVFTYEDGSGGFPPNEFSQGGIEGFAFRRLVKRFYMYEGIYQRLIFTPALQD